MTFPVVQSVTETAFSTDVTSHNVAMPATVDAGDLLVTLITVDGSSLPTTPSGWIFIGNVSIFVSNCRLGVYAKRADGTEDGTTVDWATGAGEKGAAQVYRITDWQDSGTLNTDVSAAYDADATGTNPNPPSLSPSWGAVDTLWLAVSGASTSFEYTTLPTNYTDLISTPSGGSGSGATKTSLGSARRERNASSEDPPAFTDTTEHWNAAVVAIAPSTGAAAQNLTGAGAIASAEAFGTAVVTTGAVSLTAAGAIASAEAFGTATVSAGAQDLTNAGGIASAEAFGTAAVTPGALTLTGAGAIASGEAFGTATITTGAVTLTGAGAIASAEAFGVALIRLNLTAAGGIASGEAFGVAVVTTGAVTLTGAGAIASGEAFGVTTVTPGAATVTGAGAIASGEAFGTPSVSFGAPQNLSGAGGIASAEAFGTATVAPGAFTLTSAGAIGSAQAFGTATITTGAVTVTGAGAIPSAEAFGTAIVNTAGGTQNLSGAGGIASAEVFGAPDISRQRFGTPGGWVAIPIIPHPRPTPQPTQRLRRAGGIPSAEAFGVAEIWGEDPDEELALLDL